MKDGRTIFADQATAVLYDAAVRAGAEPDVLRRQFAGIWQQLASAAETTIGKLGVPAESMADLAKLSAAGTISATAAAQISQEMYVAVKIAARESRVGERWHGRGLEQPCRLGKHGRPKPRLCHAPPICPAPLEIAQRLGLIQERDESALQAWVDEVFAANPQAVKDALRTDSKKTKGPLGFLRGQVMKVSQGKADPRLTGKLIERKLNDLRRCK